MWWAAAGRGAPHARAAFVAESGYRTVLPISLRAANVAASTFAPVQVAVPAVPTAVTTSDQSVTVAIPAGVVDPGPSAALAKLEVAPAAPPDTGSVGGVRAVRIDITKDDGTRVTQLAKPIDVVLRFTAADLARAGVSADQLQIQYSSDGVTWTPSTTSVDPTTGEARTTVDHLTIFALVGSRRPAGGPPPTPLSTPSPTPAPATATAAPTAPATSTGTATPTETP